MIVEACIIKWYWMYNRMMVNVTQPKYLGWWFYDDTLNNRHVLPNGEKNIYVGTSSQLKGSAI